MVRLSPRSFSFSRSDKNSPDKNSPAKSESKLPATGSNSTSKGKALKPSKNFVKGGFPESGGVDITATGKGPPSMPPIKGAAADGDAPAAGAGAPAAAPVPAGEHSTPTRLPLKGIPEGLPPDQPPIAGDDVASAPGTEETAVVEDSELAQEEAENIKDTRERLTKAKEAEEEMLHEVSAAICDSAKNAECERTRRSDTPAMHDWRIFRCVHREPCCR